MQCMVLSLAITAPFVGYLSNSRPAQQNDSLHTQTIDDKINKTLSESISFYSSPREIYVSPLSEDFASDSDEVLLARLLYGEARGASREVKYAIANVVLNRAERPCWWGSSVREVILAPRQFSCFNLDDVNRRKLLDPLRYDRQEVWQECRDVAREALSQRHDMTHGATHYFDSSIAIPRWARNLQPSLELPAGNGRVVKFYNSVL